jgi:hypothetical protein
MLLLAWFGWSAESVEVVGEGEGAQAWLSR